LIASCGKISFLTDHTYALLEECILFFRYEEYLILPNQADVFFYVSVTEGEDHKTQIIKQKSYVKAFVRAVNVDYARLQLDHPDLPYDRRPGEAVPLNQLNMFRKQWQGNMLVKAYEKTFGCSYSRVVRLRTDMAMFKVLVCLPIRVFSSICIKCKLNLGF
jgi:hypothetical protein